MLTITCEQLGNLNPLAIPAISPVHRSYSHIIFLTLQAVLLLISVIQAALL